MVFKYTCDSSSGNLAVLLWKDQNGTTDQNGNLKVSNWLTKDDEGRWKWDETVAPKVCRYLITEGNLGTPQAGEEEDTFKQRWVKVCASLINKVLLFIALNNKIAKKVNINIPDSQNANILEIIRVENNAFKYFPSVFGFYSDQSLSLNNTNLLIRTRFEDFLNKFIGTEFVLATGSLDVPLSLFKNIFKFANFAVKSGKDALLGGNDSDAGTILGPESGVGPFIENSTLTNVIFNNNINAESCQGTTPPSPPDTFIEAVIDALTSQYGEGAIKGKICAILAQSN